MAPKYVFVSERIVPPGAEAGGRMIGASKIARDFTEQKKAEEALQKSERRLRDAHDTLERKVEERTHRLRTGNR